MTTRSFCCSVRRAGPSENGKIYIQLSDVGGQFTDLWFTAPDLCKKEMLATALAAISTGHTVNTELDDPVQEYTQLHKLYHE